MARTKNELDEIVNQVLNFLSKRVTLTTAVLFGSYVEGRPGPYSDIDLAVFSPDIKNWTTEQRIDLAVDVRLKFTDVELHLFSDEALEKARPSNFYGHILKVGKRVA